ncbi:PAS domain S-box protein [Gammaproteobacteria bacterium AS21]
MGPMNDTARSDEQFLKIINKSRGIIDFTMDGIIISCNQVFLDCLGYTLDEIQGKHQSIFFNEDYIESSDYAVFWQRLNQGETIEEGENKYLGKNDKEVFIKTIFNPVLDDDKQPIKVIQFANDITEHKLKNAEHEGLLTAINKSQGIIEFNMDGTVISANQIFLDIIGYSLAEIKGFHHNLFCEASYANSEEYQQFWAKLNRGEFDAGEYKRIAKDGSEAFIQATYNPVFDLNNKPFKVIKFATDVTERKITNAEFECKLQAIDKSQSTLELNMDGIIVSANEKFLKIVGYTLEEIVGEHHQILCDDEYVKSHRYTDFWQKIRRGEFQSGEYKCIGKNGREAYIQATYNPIFDLNNNPIKVLNIASDVTEKKRRENENAKQAALIMDMSTPVMRLWDNVLLLPIIGLVDSKRVQTIMEAALQNILDHQAKFLILDIQGVPAIDSAVANYLIKVTQATKLMGCRCIVTGISPQISQALVNLGIDLGDILTQSTLKDGVSMSLKEMGLKLGSINS